MITTSLEGLTNDMSWSRSKILMTVGIVLWVAALTAGMSLFLGYENKAGIAAAAPNIWPAGSRIVRSPDRLTLLMFVHPHCPCSRASINEFSRLMTKVAGKVSAFVIFIKPEGVVENWEETDTWAAATKIPGVTVLTDNRGIESDLFDAHTSGQTMLYDKDGRVVFSGGITAGRGEEGDSAGATAIKALVNDESTSIAETNVFGCPLFAHDRYCEGAKQHVNTDASR